MAKRIDLPCGGWAILKDSTQLTNRERKTLRRPAIAAMGVAQALQAQLAEAEIADVVRNPSDLGSVLGEKVGAIVSAADMDSLDDVQSTAIVVYVVSWGLGPRAVDLYGAAAAAPWALQTSSIPGVTASPNPTLDTVDDLPGPVYDAMAQATVTLGDGSVDFGVDGAADPASPTVPAAV